MHADIRSKLFCAKKIKNGHGMDECCGRAKISVDVLFLDNRIL